MKRVIYNEKRCIDDLMFLLLMAVVPTILVVILSFIFLALPGERKEILQSLIVLPVSFAFIPLVLLMKREQAAIEEIGIKKLNRIEIMIAIVCLGSLYTYLIKNCSIHIIILLSVQTFIVAVSEEFWVCGILFYVLSYK